MSVLTYSKDLQLLGLVILNHEIVLQANSGVTVLFCYQIKPNAEDVNNAANQQKKQIPGHVGWPITGDRTVEFYRDVMGFVDTHQQSDCPVFKARLLNKPTVFVTSNKGVCEVLHDKTESSELGYQAFMQRVYGHNVVFSNGEESKQLRQLLLGIFESPETLSQADHVTKRSTRNMLKKLSSRKPVAVYSLMKRLTTEICLRLFLNLDFETSSSLASDIVALTTKHWHGIISVPLNFKIPLMKQTAFPKALEAKKKLLNVIESLLASSPSGLLGKMNASHFPENCPASHHILLFTSALVPKAMAALLTAFVNVMATHNGGWHSAIRRGEKNALDNVLLEVQRLWPPLVGGRRITCQACDVEGYSVPPGHGIVYMTRHAHRDPLVFPKPDEFRPQRWNKDHLKLCLAIAIHNFKNKDDQDKLYTFGGGTRACIGIKLVDQILKCVCQMLVDSYDWKLVNDQQNTAFKWLPISRPASDVQVIFTPISQNEDLYSSDDSTEEAETML